mmetsp:Transcript_10503/g.14376  ORF Transcript_10503/g.14376 Transcript_10503/m.14376 type:complete len:126 (-) Transcript_10503:41-418(-)
MDDGFDDPELEAIRQKRMQGQFGGSNMEAQQREAEKKRQIEEARQHILSQILTAEARERLSRIALVKPENARAVEDLLIRAGQSGQLTQRVDEPKLIQMLEQLNESKKTTKITIQRKRRDSDDDF